MTPVTSSGSNRLSVNAGKTSVSSSGPGCTPCLASNQAAGAFQNRASRLNPAGSRNRSRPQFSQLAKKLKPTEKTAAAIHPARANARHAGRAASARSTAKIPTTANTTSTTKNSTS